MPILIGKIWHSVITGFLRHPVLQGFRMRGPLMRTPCSFIALWKERVHKAFEMEVYIHHASAAFIGIFS